jgi:hypothetical protein
LHYFLLVTRVMAKRRSEGEMISKGRIADGLHHSVYDVEGNKLGEIRHVFLDDASGEPEWVGVETGLFGASESLVPARGASLVEDHLEVPYARATVDDAPHVEVDAGGFLAVDEEHRLYEHYRIAWDGGRGWQQVVKRPDRGGWAPSDLRTASDATQGLRFGPRPQRRRESRRRLPQNDLALAPPWRRSPVHDPADIERGPGPESPGGSCSLCLFEKR